MTTTATAQGHLPSRPVLECFSDCVKVLDFDGRVEFFNVNGLRAMEIDGLERVAGQDWPSLWPEETRLLAREAMAMARRGGSARFVGFCPTAKGTPKWWDVTVSALPDDQGATRLLVVSRDITEEHRATLDGQKNQRFQDIIGAGSDVLWDIDLTQDRVWWNEGMQSLFGYGPDQIGPSTAWFYEHIHPDERQRVVSGMAAAISHGDSAWEDQFRYRKADGTYLEVLDRGSILRGADGSARRFVGVMQNNERRRAMEARQDQLAREMAHRVNNVLAVVTSLLYQTEASSPDPDSFFKAFGDRVLAMAGANSALVKSQWNAAPLRELLTGQLEHFLREGRFSIEGPEILLDLDTAQAVALVLNELATNASKYGALSNDSGHVTLSWSIQAQAPDDQLVIVWRESGGPAVSAPTRKGVGSRLIDRGISGARVERRFDPRGFECTISAPIDGERIAVSPSA